jgi:hypothetical protein
MCPVDELDNKIELLRFQLTQLVMERGSLTDELVVRLSQLLDQYIVEHQYRARERVTSYSYNAMQNDLYV